MDYIEYKRFIKELQAEGITDLVSHMAARFDYLADDEIEAILAELA